VPAVNPVTLKVWLPADVPALWPEG